MKNRIPISLAKVWIMKGDSMDIENIICNEKSLVRNEKYRELVADDFAKKILCDIGLPVNPVYFIHFNINKIDFPSMDNYIVIGDDYGTKICINIMEKSCQLMKRKSIHRVI